MLVWQLALSGNAYDIVPRKIHAGIDIAVDLSKVHVGIGKGSTRPRDFICRTDDENHARTRQLRSQALGEGAHRSAVPRIDARNTG